MIVQCQGCRTRFRVADDKITPKGVRVRCTRCQRVFVVRGRSEPAEGQGGAQQETAEARGVSTPAPPDGSVSFDLDELLGKDFDLELHSAFDKLGLTIEPLEKNGGPNVRAGPQRGSSDPLTEEPHASQERLASPAPATGSAVPAAGVENLFDGFEVDNDGAGEVADVLDGLLGGDEETKQSPGPLEADVDAALMALESAFGVPSTAEAGQLSGGGSAPAASLDEPRQSGCLVSNSQSDAEALNEAEEPAGDLTKSEDELGWSYAESSPQDDGELAASDAPSDDSLSADSKAEDLFGWGDEGADVGSSSPLGGYELDQSSPGFQAEESASLESAAADAGASQRIDDQASLELDDDASLVLGQSDESDRSSAFEIDSLPPLELGGSLDGDPGKEDSSSLDESTLAKASSDDSLFGSVSPDGLGEEDPFETLDSEVGMTPATSAADGAAQRGATPASAPNQNRQAEPGAAGGTTAAPPAVLPERLRWASSLAWASNVAFAAAAILIALTAVVLFRTPGPVDATLLSRERIARAFAASESGDVAMHVLSAGSYRTRSGLDVLYVRGELSNVSEQEIDIRGLVVTGRLFDSRGSLVESVPAAIGRLPTAEELFDVSLARELEALLTRLDDARPAMLRPKENAAFFAAFEGAPFSGAPLAFDVSIEGVPTSNGHGSKAESGP